MLLKNNKLSRQSEAEERLAWIFISPFIAGFLFFKLLPIVYGVFISFMDYNSLRKLGKGKFIGFKNYINIFTDKTALTSYLRSFQFSLIYVVGVIVLAIVIAVILNKSFPFRTATRTMIYMPYVANVVSVAMVFGIILDPYDGPITQLLNMIGIENTPMWLGGVETALPTVAVIAIWNSLAFPVIVYLAALQEVPASLYEASNIDGANVFQKLRYITVPLISPTTFFLVITSTINSFKNYAIIKTLTNGGPGVSTRVIALNMYEEAFQFNKYSYSSAQAILVFLVIFILTMIQWKGQEKWVNY